MLPGDSHPFVFDRRVRLEKDLKNLLGAWVFVDGRIYPHTLGVEIYKRVFEKEIRVVLYEVMKFST